MKFACQLEEYMLPEFKDHYLPYTFLKKRLGEIASGQAAAAIEHLTKPQTPQRTPQANGRRLSAMLSPARSPGTPFLHRASRSSVTAICADQDCEHAAQLWWEFLERKALHIKTFVEHRLQQLVAQAGELAAVTCEHGSLVEMQLMESWQRVSEGLARLQSFADMNHAALYKITKKHDKLRETSEGREVKLPRLVEASGFAEINKRFETLEQQLRGHMLQLSQCQGLEANPRVALLVASLGPGNAGRTVLDQTFIRSERMHFFFLGCCTALLLMIITLISLPAQEPETFDPAYFLASFSVFRVVWSVLLIFWCMGAVARVCDDHFINHMFILSVEPQCRATASYLFGRAGLLTSLWILFLGMYVLDYKWMLFPTVVQTRESDYRSSWHFVLYPLVLLSLVLLMMFYNSKICRWTYKWKLLSCIGRTCLAPFYEVSFADNLVGDVMTSLAKPLEDIPSAICYLASHHPQQPEDVRAFIQSGDVCPRWVHLSVMPIIAGAPFLFRLLQCARRYRDTRENKHLLNLGKYFASLLVLVITRTWKQGTAVVTVSLIATIYAATWDIRMDWGLDCPSLRSVCSPARRGRGGSAHSGHGGSTIVSARELSAELIPPSGSPEAPQAARGELEDIRLSDSAAPGGNPRAQGDAPQRPAAPPPVGTVRLDMGETFVSAGSAANPMGRRHFGPQTYCIAALIDIVTRMTWVLTLIPITLISNDIVQRAVLQTSVATIEILRRSMWTVLRIENEQVNNASGFRALHWVPLQLNSVQLNSIIPQDRMPPLSERPARDEA